MRMLGYKAALSWIINNDDTEWLTDEYGLASVTVALVADIYGKDVEKVVRDLRQRIKVTGR